MSFAKSVPTFSGGAQLTTSNGSTHPALSDLLKDIRGHNVASVSLAADGSAGAATAEVPFYVHTGDTAKVAAIKLVPAGAATADATNTASVIVRKRNGLGGAASTIGTLITNVAGGAWAAFTTKSFASLTNTTIALGDVLTYEITKAGSGVQLPLSRLLVDIQAPLARGRRPYGSCTYQATRTARQDTNLYLRLSRYRVSRRSRMV